MPAGSKSGLNENRKYYIAIPRLANAAVTWLTYKVHISCNLSIIAPFQPQGHLNNWLIIG